jgi:hypothetical protein
MESKDVIEKYHGFAQIENQFRITCLPDLPDRQAGRFSPIYLFV